jgi:FecR protein
MPMFQVLLSQGKRIIFVLGWLLGCTMVNAAPAKIGEVTLSIGQSMIEGRVLELSSVQKGRSIFEGDTVKTFASGHVHIRFVDGAMVSVRPNSVLAIHEFKYDAANPVNSLIRLSLEAGEVRSISGAAAQAAKDRFRLNTPLAAIGVKGTDFVTIAEPQSTRVTVHQGAIVMAPFDGNCKADALGVCSGSRARELNADMAGMALVYRSGAVNPSFQTMPKNNEAEKLQPISNRLDQNSERAVASGTVVVHPEDLTISKLVWGRWSQVPKPGDSMTKDFRTAFAGNDPTVGDGYYFLFRAPEAHNLLPSLSNQVEFKLNASSAQYRAASNEMTAARVDSASLVVNFAKQTYDTRLWVSGAGFDPLSIRYAGKFDPLTGFFSDSGVNPQAKLGGSLTLNGREAGYFFLSPVGHGSVSGATLWGR